MKHRFSFGLILLSLLSMLSGCSAPEQEELQQWMQSERSSIRPQVKPIPEPGKFTPQNYSGENQTDPFDVEKLVSVLRGSQGPSPGSSALIEAELNRRKQPLESFPLDTMSMVGSLTRQGQLVALVKVDSLLYQVKVGSYLGQNYGRVLRINEVEVVLREIVQDAAGEWIERTSALQLQEDVSK